MKRNQVLQTLAQHRDELRSRFAVKSLSLFGSVARNTATQLSDVGLLVEFDRPVGYFHLFRLQEYLEKLLGGAKVDLVPQPPVIEELQDIIYGEAIDAFA
jgi:uncharacterized protein